MKFKSLLISLVLSFATIYLSGCSFKKTIYGQYSEKSGGYDYTTKVLVEIKGDEISSVRFVEDSNHHTPESQWAGAKKWKEVEQEVLKSFEGKSVKDVILSDNNIVFDNISGATLTSNRVYQAVKNALENR